MKRHRIAALVTASTLLLSLALPAMTNAEVRFDNAVGSDTLGRPVRYALYLPPGYDEDSRDYPIVYLLHGGGTGQPADWFTLAGIDQLFDRLITEGEIRPFIAVAPDGRRDESNAVATYFLDDADAETRWETMFFDDFIPAVETRYRALGGGEARAALGISMGAVAATVYQLHAPSRFAGIAALSPAFRSDTQLLGLSPDAYRSRYGGLLGEGLEGDARLNDAWEALRPETLVAQTDGARFRRVPRVYFDIGADDPFFEGAADLHLSLRDAGILHRFRVTEGGHDWPFWRGALEDAVLHLDAVLTRDYGE